MMGRGMRILSVAMLLASSAAAFSQTVGGKPPLAVEESDTVTLPAPLPHWVIVEGSWELPGARIFDGDSGKMIGQAELSTLASFAADPKGRFYYVAESIWTKGNRGTRQDMLTVRDSRTLEVVREIPLPGRLIAGTRKHLLGIGADGRHAFVYNMDPASSVIVVDLDKNRVAAVVEVPGCSLSAAVGAGRAMSLCSDGSLAISTLAGAKSGKVETSAPFFAAENDPVFDNSPIHTKSGTAMLLSYSGLVFEARLASKIDVSAGWSIQEAAGLPRATTAPLIPNWLPGGYQPAAYHKATGRLYILMHLGEFWSAKQAGTELWVLDSATRKLIARKKLEQPAVAVLATQDDKPLLFIEDEKSLLVLDALTLKEKRKMEETGVGLLSLATDGS